MRKYRLSKEHRDTNANAKDEMNSKQAANCRAFVLLEHILLRADVEGFSSYSQKDDFDVRTRLQFGKAARQGSIMSVMA